MSDLDFTGRTVLVTGGASGIGAATAAAFAARGAVTYALDVAEPPAGSVRFLRADVASPQEVEAAVARIEAETGRLDVLVTAAGITRDRVLWKLADGDWDDVIRVNLRGTFTPLRAVLPGMRARGGGAVVLVSSINGERGKFGQANYAASKAGVIALGKSAAREAGARGIRVNIVAPGLTDTPMTRRMPAEAFEAGVRETVLGRAADPADVAGPILFLASDLARHVTGQVLRVDGGQYM